MTLTDSVDAFFERFLVSVGCVNPIICQALDRITRQVLVYRSKLVPNGEAWVKRFQTYGGGWTDRPLGGHIILLFSRAWYR